MYIILIIVDYNSSKIVIGTMKEKFWTLSCNLKRKYAIDTSKFNHNKYEIVKFVGNIY